MLGIAQRMAKGIEDSLSRKKMRVRVPADQVAKERKRYEEMGMASSVEIIPVDLYGKRTAFPKGTNLKEVERDIREVQGLD